MGPDALTIPAANGKGKVRLLTRKHLDGRTKARRQFDAIVNAIASDLGGANRLSTVQSHLIEGFAGAAVIVHDLNAKMLLGKQVDLLQYGSAVSTLVRLASRVGLGRVAKDIPPLRDYLEARAEGQ